MFKLKESGLLIFLISLFYGIAYITRKLDILLLKEFGFKLEIESFNSFSDYIGYGILGVLSLITLVLLLFLVGALIYYLIINPINKFIKWNWEMAKKEAKKELKEK
ncbi:MAG: hypothetical protein WC758_08115 [Candidatus Woesearchaeota archaeon]